MSVRPSIRIRPSKAQRHTSSMTQETLKLGRTVVGTRLALRRR